MSSLSTEVVWWVAHDAWYSVGEVDSHTSKGQEEVKECEECCNVRMPGWWELKRKIKE